MPATAGRSTTATVERLSTAPQPVLRDAARPPTTSSPRTSSSTCYPPFWRFQLQGRDAIAAQLRTLTEGREVTPRILRVVPTGDGFLMEHEETSRGEPPRSPASCGSARCATARSSRSTCYCNGGWDDELRARHAAEAPMLRP